MPPRQEGLVRNDAQKGKKKPARAQKIKPVSCAKNFAYGNTFDAGSKEGGDRDFFRPGASIKK